MKDFKEMTKEEFTKKDSKELAQWLNEVFPKKYRMAPYQILVDTRPSDNPTEYCILLHDD